MNPRFRRAVSDDVPAINRLLSELAAHDGHDLHDTSAALRQHGFGPVPRFRVILAETDARPVGLVLFFPEYSSWRGSMGTFVQDLFVAPDARGTGLGRALLAEMVQSAADWDSSFVTLLVQRNNAIGRNFYRGLGFTLRGDADYLILEGTALAALQNP